MDFLTVLFFSCNIIRLRATQGPANQLNSQGDPGHRNSHYANLPIFRDAADLALATERAVTSMARRNKFALGADLRSHALGILLDVARANRREQRREVREAVR